MNAQSKVRAIASDDAPSPLGKPEPEDGLGPDGRVSTIAGLAKLREPFPAHQISKLPKPYKRDSAKGKCAECGGYHGLPAVHLDYVGHAALTDRLLDTDPHWSWEPMGYTAEGLPAYDQRGGLWIRLTVLGMTRPGYGCADGKQGGDAVKEIIGDALRNAAMRFGAALDLWHKGDLHVEDAAEDTKPGEMPDAEWARLVQLMEATSADSGRMLKHYGVESLRQLNQDQYSHCIGALNSKLAKMAKEETNAKARQEAPAGEFDNLAEDMIPY